MAPEVHDATPDEVEWIKYDVDQQKALGAYFVGKSDKFSEIFTAVNGIYVGLLTLFGFLNAGVLMSIPYPQTLIFLVPIIGWLVGITFFLQINQPSIKEMPPNSPSEIRKNLYHSNVVKAKNYQRGLWAFGIGTMLMIGVLVYGLSLAAVSVPPTPAKDVQFIIKADDVQLIRQIPIDFIPGTNKTVPVSLLNTTDTAYRIELESGDIVELEKISVQTVIWK